MKELERRRNQEIVLALTKKMIDLIKVRAFSLQLLVLISGLIACDVSQEQTELDFNSQDNIRVKNEIINPIKINCNNYQFDSETRVLQKLNGEVLKQYDYDRGFCDELKKVLFLVSKKSGITVLNLCKGNELLNIPSIDSSNILAFYKLGDRYFFTQDIKMSNIVEVWEFEFYLGRIEIVDLSINELGAEKLISIEINFAFVLLLR